MNKKLIPTFHLKNIFELKSDFLHSLNVKNIFIDLDNTLANPYVSLPDENVKKFILSLKDFNIVVLSNNHEARVKKFTEPLNLKYICEVKKPSPKKVKNYITENHLTKDECIAIGDQVMTDVLCANNVGIKVILVDPLTLQDEPITFLPRLLDRYFRKKIFKRNLTKEI